MAYNHRARIVSLGDRARQAFTRKHQARERALQLSRETIQHSANTIRATHRGEFNEARRLLEATRDRVTEMEGLLRRHQDIYHAGFVHDAQKEYAEAHCTLAFVVGEALPGPRELKIGHAPYLNGLGEAVGEMRRYLLDSLRRDDVSRCEELMETMSEVYNVLVTMDFPDALTRGLRRTTDMVRGVLERTRGDLTMALRQRSLEQRLALLEKGALPTPPAPRRGRRARQAPAVAPAPTRRGGRPARPRTSQGVPAETLEPYLQKARPAVAREFQALRSTLLGLGPDVQEVPERQGRIAYRRGGLQGRRGWKKFCVVFPQRKQLRVWLGPRARWQDYPVHADQHNAWYRWRPRKKEGNRQELLSLVRRAYDLARERR